MLNQEEFRKFIGEITVAEFPTESLSFRISGKHKVEQLYARSEGSPDAPKAQELLPFAGGAEATAVLEFVKLAAGTLLVVKQVWDAWHPETKDDTKPQGSPVPAGDAQGLKDLWLKHLIESGLSEAKAASVVERFSDDLQARLA